MTGGYDDFNSGNIGGVIARLHPGVEWIKPGGGNAPAGTFKGPDSVANDVFGPPHPTGGVASSRGWVRATTG